MARHYGKKAAAVLVLSLLLANHYVEYGKRVKASETEKMMMAGRGENETEALGSFGKEKEFEMESWSETNNRSDSGTESEGKTERESETESESGTESDSETGNESGTESDSEMGNESGIESGGETGNESGIESGGEMGNESGIESGGEMESESGTENGSGVESECKLESEHEIEGESKAENGSDMKAETEIREGIESEKNRESDTKTEKEADAEKKDETENKTGLEDETERKQETETDQETEMEQETGTDQESEIEQETGTNQESETELETEIDQESESESEKENETERETESEGETETEPVPSIIRVRNIKIKETEGGRIYDGTNQIELSYEVEGMQDGMSVSVQYEARMNGCDVGERKVEYRFQLSEDEMDMYQLEVEEVPLTVWVKPRVLSIDIPDGWKAYGSEVKMENIHLLGEVEVEGFITNEEGNEIIPEGFRAPEIEVDTSVVNQWSDIYEKGTQKVYENALILSRTKKGKVKGESTPNYVFADDNGTEDCKNGSLIIAPSEIRRDIEYRISGEEGSFYQAEDGKIWIRQGTGLHIYPLQGSGYTHGWEVEALERSGPLFFSLKKRNGEGEITAESLETQADVRVDAGVPEAVVEIGGGREEEGIIYGKQAVNVSIKVPEDEGSGMKSARYFIAGSGALFSAAVQGENEWWQECMQGAELMLSENGTYVIYVETEDRTGNKAYVKSKQIVVDSEGPQLWLEGVENNSANAGDIYLMVSCKDACYRDASLQVEISGANGGILPQQMERRATEQGEEILFADFPHEKKADDIYTVHVAAEDLAGNKTKKTVTFSVNRFGSVYDLSEETKQELQKFYHRTAFPVVFLETNIDYVGEAQILCRRDGNLWELEEGREYTVHQSGGDSSWKQYCYTISENTFQKEGTYEVMLLSKDQAKNSGDSQAQEKAVRFTIDQSPPECLITGLEENGIYQTDILWACLEPRDNACLKEMKVYMDSQEKAVYGKKEIEELGGVVKWRAVAKERWQRIQICVSDEAGNRTWTEELPFYVTENEKPDEILPFVKTEKSARELAEEVPVFSSAGIKKQGQRTEDADGTDYGEEELEKGRDAEGGSVKTAAEKFYGFLQNILTVKVVFLCTGILTVFFFLLSVSIWYFKRKR